MYLSNLRIIGFKSFASRTLIEFTDGIIGVVGPNGCGKSNIVDAIRWVLGEQRYTALRSSKMEDVIFNGSSTQAPQNMAEVTITIENNKGLLPLIYQQVSITRRIYRSGESEYYINGNRCRLKDISELFMDTGVGNHAYSIIEQQMVSAILSEKREDRKFIFEEAAGIMKYKEKKKEALNKLAANENDLLRVNDLILEIEKNVAALKKQSHKAQRYKVLKQEIRSRELYYFQYNYKELESRLQPLSEESSRLKDEKEKNNTDYTAQEAQLIEASHRIIQHNTFLQQIQKKFLDLQSAQNQTNQEITLGQERIRSKQSENQRYKQELEQSEQQQIGIEQAMLQRRKELEEHQLRLGVFDQRLNAQADLQSRELTDNKGLSDQMQENQQLKESLHKEFDQYQNTISLVKQKKEMIEKELDSIRHQADEIGQKRDHRQAEHLQLMKEKNEHLLKIKVADEDFYRYEFQIKEVVDKKAQIQEQWTDSDREITRLQDKLELLRNADFQKNLQHPDDQVTVNYFRGHGQNFIFLLDYINPVPEYQTAVQNLARYLKTYLIQVDKSESLFMPEEWPEHSIALVLPGLHNLSRPEFPGARPLMECLETDPDYRDLISRVFRYVLLVDDIRKITLPEECPAVVLLDRQGTIWDLRTGYIEHLKGESDQATPSAIFGRRIKIETLEKELEITRKEFNFVQQNKIKIESQYQSLKTYLEQAQKDKNSVQQNLSACANKIALITSELEQWTGRLDELDLRSQQYQKNRGQFDTEMNNLEQRKVETHLKLDTVLAASDEIEKQYRIFQAKLQTMVSEANQLKIEYIREEEKCKSLNFETEQFQQKKQELTERQNKIRLTMQENEKLNQQIQHQSIQLDQFSHRQAVDLEQVTVEREKINAQIVSRQSANDLIQKKQKELREKEQKLQQLIDQTRETQSRLEQEKALLKDQLMLKYQIQPEDLTRMCPTLETVPDWTALQTEIEQMNLKMDNLGNVNFEAIEEYNTQKTRYEFYQEQQADLIKAKNTLMDTIHRINRAAEEMYLIAFNQIKENFKKIFIHLFSGGECDLILERNPDDPLDLDVSILAKPKGKKIQHIALLSGGEKALTSIALLFAIYLVKPSPYCILDEVDAPLDDANISRFLNLIRDFSKNTQFIIITHNKKTMEETDLLYGITMEEPGVSKVVSVKVKQEGFLSS